jgi:hypothetical protein
VSGAVRYLTQVGMVAATGEPGSRRLSYSVPDDVWAQLIPGQPGPGRMAPGLAARHDETRRGRPARDDPFRRKNF